MARRWRPKYIVICPNCAWKGRRTDFNMCCRCPQCHFYHPVKYPASQAKDGGQ